MKVRFIVNPKAGGSATIGKITDAVREVLSSDEGVFEIKATTGKESAGILAAEAVEKRYDFVFACGGDGTVNDVASRLVGTDTALGIVSAGSGNALANSLGIPREARAAIALLKGLKVKKIDVGTACGKYFFTTAGFGFEAYLSKKYNEGYLSRKIRGLLPYFPLALLGYFRYRPRPVDVSIDGETIGITPLILTAANTGQFGGGAFISPGASPDDGLLDCCLVPATNIFSAVNLGCKLFSKKIEAYKGFRCIRGKSVVITGPGLTYAHVDGEPFEWSGDISIGILPGRLKVLAG